MGLEQLCKINDFCLFVKDLEEAVDFYTQKCDFKVIRRQPGYVEFEFQGTSITLWQEDGVQQAIPAKYLGGEGHHFMIAIRLPAYEDVDSIYKELDSRGVKFIAPPVTYPWDARAAYFNDIDGNIWEIFAFKSDVVPGML